MAGGTNFAVQLYKYIKVQGLPRDVRSELMKNTIKAFIKRNPILNLDVDESRRHL
jgi:hypothetical protein